MAFFGGTFTGLAPTLQKNLLKLLQPLLDEKTAIRISTRPDRITPENLVFLKSMGVRTIELGIQSFSDQVLIASKRGYNSATATKSCKLIKQSGLKLGIQIMPGLPGSDAEALECTIQQTITLDPSFIRVYPTIVLQDTVLADKYSNGEYTPLSLEAATSICSGISRRMDKHNIDIIKMGLHSDIDPEAVLAGPYHQSFGELVRAEILYENIIAEFSCKSTLHISSQDISLFKGFASTMLKKLQATLKLPKIPIIIDKSLTKNSFKFSSNPTEIYW